MGMYTLYLKTMDKALLVNHKRGIKVFILMLLTVNPQQGNFMPSVCGQITYLIFPLDYDWYTMGIGKLDSSNKYNFLKKTTYCVFASYLRMRILQYSK